MFRIDHTTAAAERPTPETAGTPGFFTGGDPVGGVPATVVTADFMNMIQEELISILTAASITPSKTAINQLLTALQSLFVSSSEFTGSNQLLTDNGYKKIPGGFVLQWSSATTSSSTVTATFPIEFPNTCHKVIATHGSASGAQTVAVSNLTKTGATLHFAAGDGTIAYLAIGH